MEIKLDLNAGKVAPVPAAKPATQAAKAAEDSTEFRAAAALEQALEKTPEVRSDVVDNAKRLVGDPNYPPRETLQKIATLLALQMKP